MSMAVLTSWLLTLGLGAGIWSLLCGVPRHLDERITALGHAIVLGLCAAGMLVGTARSVPGANLWNSLWLWLLLGIGLLWIFLIWRLRHAAALSVHPRTRQPLQFWAWALLLLLLAHALLVVDEAWLRPIFPWDAWLAWSAKAKAWFEGSQAQHFVRPDAWLADSNGHSRTSLAYHYPELLARIELWLSAPYGIWNEVAINMAWPLLWLAMLLGCYGQWRRLGVENNLAVVGVYALGSLPLLDAHAALAGYADLWIAVSLVFAILAWQIFLRTRARGSLLLSLVFLVFVSLLKFEGFAWSLLLVGVMVLGEIPARHRWKGIGVAISVGLLALALSYWLNLPWFDMAHRLLSGESGGKAAANWWSIARALASGLIVQNNWNLLWLIVPVSLAWRWRALIAQRELGLLALYVGSALGLVAALFLLTPAAKWAESNTAINRLVLQLVPSAVSLVVLLLRDVELLLLFRRTHREFAGQPAAE